LKTVRARDVFVKELGKVRDEMGFELLGYVVMPEHVHLLMFYYGGEKGLLAMDVGE
jgi:REP element-mobilizing transposase RayT